MPSCRAPPIVPRVQAQSTVELFFSSRYTELSESRRDLAQHTCVFSCSQRLITLPCAITQPAIISHGNLFPAATAVPITDGNHRPIRLTCPYWKSQRPARCSPPCPAARCCPPPPCSGPALPRRSPGARPIQAEMLSLASLCRWGPLPSPHPDQGLLFSTFLHCEFRN